MEEAGREGEAGEFARLDCGGSLRLLASVRVGRLIFTVPALPAVRLVTFAVAGGLIVVRAARGCAVARKVHAMIVAFEADELDNATCSGWSVTVVGRAALVTDPGTAARFVPFFLGRSFERTSRAETRPSAAAARMAPPEARREGTGR